MAAMWDTEDLDSHVQHLITLCKPAGVCIVFIFMPFLLQVIYVSNLNFC